MWWFLFPHGSRGWQAWVVQWVEMSIEPVIEKVYTQDPLYKAMQMPKQFHMTDARVSSDVWGTWGCCSFVHIYNDMVLAGDICCLVCFVNFTIFRYSPRVQQTADANFLSVRLSFPLPTVTRKALQLHQSRMLAPNHSSDLINVGENNSFTILNAHQTHALIVWGQYKSWSFSWFWFFKNRCCYSVSQGGGNKLCKMLVCDGQAIGL